ncbi:MAG: hypothetical protein ACRCUJ_07600, partial [Phocaeicola sp.]
VAIQQGLFYTPFRGSQLLFQLFLNKAVPLYMRARVLSHTLKDVKEYLKNPRLIICNSNSQPVKRCRGEYYSIKNKDTRKEKYTMNR